MSLDLTEFLKWVTETSAWLMSAQAIVLSIIQAFNINFPWRQIATVLLIFGLFASTLTITGAFNYMSKKSENYLKVAQWASNFSVWFFLTGLIALGISVIVNG